MHIRHLRSATLVLALTAVAATSAQQAPPPVFRSRVDAIEIELRVIDAAGKPVTDLRVDELEVFDEGRKQAIVGFSHVSVPIVPPPAATAAPVLSSPADVATNRTAAASRIFVVMLDDLHVESGNSSELKKVARQFVERHVGPGDMVSVIYSSGRSDAAVDFTTDRGQVIGAIDKFVGRKLRPATVERMDQYNMQFRNRGAPNFEDIRDKSEGERGFNARAVFGTIEIVSTVLSRVPGRRKAMLLFSEGMDYDLTGTRARPMGGSSRTVLPDTVPTGGSEVDALGRTDVASGDAVLSLQAAIGAAVRANVALYGLDIGRGNVSDSLTQMGAPVQDAALGLTPRNVALDVRNSQEALRTLAETTGGFATLAASDYEPAFSRILQESSDYYVVAYSPWNIVMDGKFREITVKVKRPGVKVMARKGYYAPRAHPRRVARFVAPGVSEETSALVMAPMPASGLSLDVQTVALRRVGKKADVVIAVHVDGKELVPDPSASAVENTIELAFMALDSAGRVQAANGMAVRIRLDEATVRLCHEMGYRAFSQLQIPPGRYRIRVAARETASGRHGSVFADLDVPDFSKRLTMSNVLIASERVGAVPTSIDRETLTRLPVMPVVGRAFPPSDQLQAAVEVYHDERDTDHVVTTRIYDARGAEVFTRATPVPAERFKKSGAHLHSVRIPLKSLSGQMLLEFGVRTASASKDAVTRRVPFTVAADASLPAGPTP